MKYYELAEAKQHLYDAPIILAKQGNREKELSEEVTGGCDDITFLTLKEQSGHDAYLRSVKFLLFKAFYEKLGVEHIKRLNVLFSLGPNLYLEYDGDILLTEELLAEIKAAMKKDVEADLRIEKEVLPTDVALDKFRALHMYDKEQVFHYRRVSTITVYKLGDYVDYYYGDMVYSTSVLEQFELELYKDGFLLKIPGMTDITKIPETPKLDHLYAKLKQSFEWSKSIGITTVGDLNDAIVNKEINDIIIMQEAMVERQISDIAENIVSDPKIKFVMIAGPSSSGKTSFAHRLSIQLKSFGIKPHPISVDDYFINRSEVIPEPDGSLNLESINIVDTKLFNEDMVSLLEGKTIQMPTFNFVTGMREYNGETLTMGEKDILVIEGIHCLNDKMSYALSDENKYRIYVSALTQIRMDEHNRIPSSDLRLLRRMARDDRTRGTSAQETIRSWKKVRAGEEENIFPYQENADVMFNSCLIYELLITKQIAEPLLFGVDKDSEEYTKAKRLLKFLDSFLSFNDKAIPINSLLKEFIGGSYFNV